MTCSLLAQMGKLIPSARGEPEPQALMSQSGKSGQVKNKALALGTRDIQIMRLCVHMLQCPQEKSKVRTSSGS
ncbi:hypothetical protein [Nostoc parmelioides]|uniref:Uncharacterized protein n=1 Tax=Nostoc parmelioides FACHB-3921 TaxID=2692909 RepID=A0ABR8BDL4_9NOSO|nr:hypothetical protein [Nostoc parmelioides]MBD2251865.1 hypothetical protein [Nostoc parmelioides FACHB-3921]